MSTVQSEADAEDGRSSGSHRGPNQGRLWEMDQRIDKPLGVEADHVPSMFLNQVRASPILALKSTPPSSDFASSQYLSGEFSDGSRVFAKFGVRFGASSLLSVPSI